MIAAAVVPPLLALTAYVVGIFNEENPIFEKILWPTEGVGIVSIASWVAYRVSGKPLLLVLAIASLITFLALAACGFFM